MKKLCTLLLLVVCLGMALPAQAQLRFGIKGGASLSEADFSNLAGNLKKENCTGYFIGPMAEFTIPVVGLGIDAALMFAQRGIKTDGRSVKQNGVNVPVNLKYNIGLGSAAGIYLSAGPDIFFDLSGSKSIEGIKLEKKKADVGLSVGAGVKLLGHLQVGANYVFPLSDTATFEGAMKGSYKTKSWQVSVAYLF